MSSLPELKLDSTTSITDTLQFFAEISPLIGDTNKLNNKDTAIAMVWGSYDPNYKSIEPQGPLQIHEVQAGMALDYTIHFQNIGNDTAINVMILDTLNFNLEISSIKIIGASHPYTLAMYDQNLLQFKFDNIYLPDSGADLWQSHGFIRYTISPKTNLAEGDSIFNTAHIYFDFNPPVVTNTTSNIIIDTEFNYINSSSDISVYPNPTTNSITIATKNIGNKSNATLYDMQGRELKTQKLNTQHTQINLQGLSEGNYMLKVMDGESLVGVKRVVRVK